MYSLNESDMTTIILVTRVTGKLEIKHGNGDDITPDEAIQYFKNLKLEQKLEKKNA